MSRTDKHSIDTSFADKASTQSVDPGKALRRQAEEIFLKNPARSPVVHYFSMSEETRKVIRELQLHQIELEIQNQQLRQRQDELEAVRSRYFDLYDTAPIGYLTLDTKGLITEANQTAAELLGTMRDEVVNHPVTRFILRDDQDIYYLFCKKFMKVRDLPPGTRETCSEQAAAPQGCDLRMLKKGGKAFFHARLQAISYLGHESTPVYRVALTDITQHIEAEALRTKLEAKNQRIHKAESLERMAGSICHLFNKHLSTVVSDLELALEEGASKKLSREKLIAALQAAHKSVEVCELMAAYLGHNNVKQELLDLSETCSRPLPEIMAFIPSGVTLRTNFVSPGPVVHANSSQIMHILSNLIANGSDAIKIHSGKGEVKVDIKTLSVSDISSSYYFSADCVPFAETFACLEVTDTGCGMSKEEVIKIFDPFYSTKGVGKGLGLAIAKRFAKSWGGMIGVQTAVGVGSSIRVFIPLVENAVAR